jgi:amino acid permease
MRATGIASSPAAIVEMSLPLQLANRSFLPAKDCPTPLVVAHRVAPLGAVSSPMVVVHVLHVVNSTMLFVLRVVVQQLYLLCPAKIVQSIVAIVSNHNVHHAVLVKRVIAIVSVTTIAVTVVVVVAVAVTAGVVETVTAVITAATAVITAGMTAGRNRNMVQRVIAPGLPSPSYFLSSLPPLSPLCMLYYVNISH